MKLRWYSLFLALLMSLHSVVWAQQRSFEEYEGQPEKYLGKEVTLGCQSAKRLNGVPGVDHLLGNNVLFHVYTMGRGTTEWCYALVPFSEADSFSRRFNSDTTNKRFTTRPLRGVFLKLNNFYYLGYKGATLGTDPKAK
jgi:hypothetical protein